MKKDKVKTYNNEFNGLNRESEIFKRFRMISAFNIKYFGRFFHCLRIGFLIKSILFSKSWIESSGKDALPPDFHNERHHIMMEFMRIDDAVRKINGKKVPSSLGRAELYFKKALGANYKSILNNSTMFFIPDTSDDTKYSFKGYFSNFEKVLLNHSNKVETYHKNYPKCKTCVLFICDESNAYYQPTDDGKKNRLHLCFYDQKFIDIIKKCNADYIVWFTLYKTVIRENGKKIKQPIACIYDVKHIKFVGLEYDHNKMVKIK